MSNNNLSDQFTAGVDEIFRITSHVQGRMSLYLAEASVLEERSQRTSTDEEQKTLQDELSSLDVLLHQINDITEAWDILEDKAAKRVFSEELARVLRQYVKKSETVKESQISKPRKYKPVLTEPSIESSVECLMELIRQGR